MFGLFRSREVNVQPRCLISPRMATKGTVLSGEVGAGKSTILFQLMQQWASADEEVYFACTTNKPSDAEDYERILRAAGRDPLMIRADGSFGISPFIHELTRPGGSVRNLVAMHQDLLEVLTRSDSSRTETFWKGITEDTGLNAFSLAHLVNDRPTYRDVADIVMSIPQNAEQAASPEFATTACGLFLDKAFAIDRERASSIADHMLRRMPSVGSKASAAATTGAMQSIQPFIAEPIASIVNRTPTHSVAELLERDIILALDTNTYGKNGLAMQLMLVWLLQEEVLRRTGDYPYWCLVRDECGQTSFARRDIPTQAMGRQARYMSVSAFQTLNSLVSQLGGGMEAANEAKALYGLNVNKVMCRQGSDAETAELNASAIGRELKMFYGGGTQPRQEEHKWWDVLCVGEPPSMSFNQNYHFKVEPSVFQTLAAGGPEYGYVVEAIIFDGTNYYRHPFYQR